MSPKHLIISYLMLLGTACFGEQEKNSVPDAEPMKSLTIANRVASWLDAQAIETADGVDWVIDVDAVEPKRSTGLYHGTAGIILFYLEHHHTTKRARSLELARKAAQELWAKLGHRLDKQPMSLYTGIAGIAFTFSELYKTTKAPSDKQRVLACLQALESRAQKKGSSCDWNPVTDIIRGTAGIGLALLRIAEDLGLDTARKLAECAGRRLLAQAEKAGSYLRWSLSKDYKLKMPNFSHGTAGIAYFLARLYRATGDKAFLDAAVAGAEFLLSIQGEDGYIFHDDEHKELDYLSWCHGPPGTARLFWILHDITGEARYHDWIDKVASSINSTSIPGNKTPGFWNNHGQCCGTAGVADFFMQLEISSADANLHKRIDDLVQALARAATSRKAGPAWTGAEHRVRPQELSTQTGYMQGAAGIGLLFLHDVARRTGRARRIVLPDATRLPH